MRKTRPVQVKHIQIGGGAPVVIQSMTKTDTSDVGATVAQIEEMVRAGCEIVRLAVPDNDAAIALKEIRKRVPDVPIVADIHFHEDLDFTDIIVSLKASDVHRTVEAYRLLAQKVDYPFHLGVTEAGTSFSGTVKSSIGLGILLYEGIGDTIRVSLAAEPQEEVRVAWEIVKSLGLRTRGVTVVACPTCGRLDVDNFVGIVTEIERRLAHIEEPLHLSIMGCAVNGPGEAHDSQLGITFGRGVGMIFKDGVPMRKVAGENIVEAFVMETEKLLDELRNKPPAEPQPELVTI